MRVRITAGSPDAVALNAVGRGALIVTARATEDVTPRCASMVIVGVLIGTHPPGRMRIFRAHASRADAARLVTRITRLHAMAAQATRRLSLSLPGVTSEKVGWMDERFVDLFCLAHFNTQTLRDVVTIITTLGGVALRTLDSRFQGFRRVLSIPASPMTQHGPREQLL